MQARAYSTLHKLLEHILSLSPIHVQKFYLIRNITVVNVSHLPTDSTVDITWEREAIREQGAWVHVPPLVEKGDIACICTPGVDRSNNNNNEEIYIARP